jgi:hypothetical protein
MANPIYQPELRDAVSAETLLNNTAGRPTIRKSIPYLLHTSLTIHQNYYLCHLFLILLPLSITVESVHLGIH